MGVSNAIDLTREQHDTVLTLLEKHLPGTTAWAYGSRVKWTSRPNSDLDLVVFASPEQSRQVSYLRDAFAESNLPFRVDLFVWDAIPDSFRANIETSHVVLYEPLNMCSLKNLVDLRLSSVDKKIKPGEHHITLCNYLDVYKNDFIGPDIRFMDGSATEVEISKCQLQLNDVVITKDSEQYDDIGVPALMRHQVDNLICGYHLAILRPDESKVYGPYLYYALNIDEVKKQFHSYANGVTRFGLRKADMLRVEIPLPDIDAQRSIADVLVALDDKIELNRLIIQTLEDMARLLYREWFVHFRFPGHEDVKLVDSDLGMIPEGWEVCYLGDILEFAYGKALKADDRMGGPVSVYGSGGQVGWHDEALVTGPGIVVGRKGNVGAVYWADRDFFPIDTTYYVKSELPFRFLDQMLRKQEFIDSHAAVPGLSRDQAYSLTIAKPDCCLL